MKTPSLPRLIDRFNIAGVGWEMNTKAAFILAFGMIGAAFLWTDKGASIAVAQAVPSPLLDRMSGQGVDVLLTMPLLESQGWFIHAYGGRVRACSVDGASVVGDRTAPRCSNWSD